MSHDHASNGSAAGRTVADDLAGLMKAGTKLMSPRENVTSPTIVQNVASAIGQTWGAIKAVVGAVVDLPLGVAETLIATPNNLLGLATTGVDKAIVQPIDWTRTRVRALIANPSSLFAGGTGGGGHDDAHAA